MMFGIKKNIILGILLLGHSVIFLNSQTSLEDFRDRDNSSMLALSSPVYEYLDALYLETGLPPAFPARPVSLGELKLALSKISSSSLSKAGQRVYSIIEKELGFIPTYQEDGGLWLSFEPRLTAEYFASQNPEKWDSKAYTELGDDIWAMDREWIVNSVERKPFLDLPLQWGFVPGLSVLVRPDVKLDYRARTTSETGYGPLSSNISTDVLAYDFYIPKDAYISAGSEHWNLVFGRSSYNWGNGLSGNLLLSDVSEYFDAISFSTFWKDFKFSAMYATLEPWLKDNASFPLVGDVGPSNVAPDMYRAFAAHRLDLRLFDKINLAINESTVIGYKGADLVAHLNPFMVFHQWFMFEGSNLLLTLEASANPWKYLEVHTQIAFDDIVSSYEKEAALSPLTRYGSGAYLYGAKLELPLDEGYLSANAELVLCDPWFNNHDMLYMKYLNSFRRWSFLEPDRFIWVEKPLGYVAGSDVRVLEANLAWKVPASYKIELGFVREETGLLNTRNHIRSGEYGYNPSTDGLDHAWANDVTLLSEGPVQVRTEIVLSGEYDFLDTFSLGALAGLQFYENFRHVEGRTLNDLEVAAWLSWKP